MVTLCLRVAPILAFIKFLFDVKPNWNKIVILISAVAIGVITNLLIEFIYKRTDLKLGKCPFNIDYVIERAHRIHLNGSSFKISDECELNNLFVQMHHEYLNEVKDKIYSRFYVRKIVHGFGAIIYLVFFLRVPE